WLAVVFSALFAIGLAYLIWYRGVETIGNTRTAIFSNLSPVVAVVAAAVLLHEHPSEWALAGAALTLGGVMLVRSDPGHATPALVAEAEAAD
ncbi:MAG TPA: DMT family transporter, partial [Longimicrobiaceae bacterium]